MLLFEECRVHAMLHMMNVGPKTGETTLTTANIDSVPVISNTSPSQVMGNILCDFNLCKPLSNKVEVGDR